MKNSLFQRLFNRQDETAQSHSVDFSRLEGLKVLVVDDSRTQLYAIERMLKSYGVNTLIAENGKQGILMARHKLPDLVLMDIVMPEINGFQATRYLSRLPETQHIPIIIISGSDQESDKAWGLKLGARDYLSKPVSKDLLVNKICQVLAEAESSVSQVNQPSMVKAV